MKNRSSYASILKVEIGKKEQRIVVYYDSKQQVKSEEALLVDLTSKNDREHLVLDNGIEIPIDQIASVDGEISPNYRLEFDGCSCM